MTNIETYNYALGNKNAIEKIYNNSSNASSSSMLVQGENFIQDVEIRKLDDMPDIPKADFIKIDVEGFELEVLLGARRFINENKPKILVEFSPYLYNKKDGQVSQKIISFLLENGYVVFDIGEKNDRKINVNKLEDLKDQSQTYLFCETN